MIKKILIMFVIFCVGYGIQVTVFAGNDPEEAVMTADILSQDITIVYPSFYATWTLDVTLNQNLATPAEGVNVDIKIEWSNDNIQYGAGNTFTPEGMQMQDAGDSAVVTVQYDASAPAGATISSVTFTVSPKY